MYLFLILLFFFSVKQLVALKEDKIYFIHIVLDRMDKKQTINDKKWKMYYLSGSKVAELDFFALVSSKK